MALFRVKTHVPDAGRLTEELKKAMKTTEFASKIDKSVVKTLILPRMKIGIAPVRGWGRYEKYKNPEKYPGDRKPKRPVSLYLTGRLQENYKAEARGDGTHIGLSVSAPRDVKEYAGYLQEGTEHMARRPIVPGEGEQWAVAIQRKLRDVFVEMTQKLFYRTKRRRR